MHDGPAISDSGAQDDLKIPNDDVAFRRVPHAEAFIDWDWNESRWVPTNAAMRDQSGGTEISIYLRSFLSASEGPDDVAATRPGSVAFGVGAGDARDLGFGLTHRPDQDAGPLRHAHGNINGDPAWRKAEYRAQRNDLVRKMTLAAGEVTLKRPA